MGLTRENLGPAARAHYDSVKAAQGQVVIADPHISQRTTKGIRASNTKALEFLLLCQRAGLPTPILECVFHPPRKWRFDVAFVREKLAVEIQGGIFISGRHTRGVSFIKDMEKANSAAILGWRIIYRSPKDFLSNETVEIVRRAMRIRR